jgi:TonB family protein
VVTHMLAVVAILAACGSLALGAQRDARPESGVASGILPALVFSVMPEYPLIARAATVSGIVTLNVVVGPDGSPSTVQVTRSVSSLLDAPAVAAVRRWRFNPPPAGTSASLTVNVEYQVGSMPSAFLERLSPSTPGVPTDFAWHYEYECAAGRGVLDATRGTIAASERTAAGVGSNGRAAKVDEAKLYRTFVEAGLFDGLAARRPVTSSLAVTSAGIDVTVLGDLPRVDVVSAHAPSGPQRFEQRLAAKRDGQQYVARWLEPLTPSDTDAARRLAALARAVREMVVATAGAPIARNPDCGRN